MWQLKDWGKMQFNEILERLGGGEQQGGGYKTLCPAHPDTNPSLVVTLREDGMVLMHCQSHGCRFEDITAAIGLTAADCRGVEAGEEIVTSQSMGVKPPPSAGQINWLRDFIDEAHNNLSDSALEYAYERWGITAEMASVLKLGYTDRGVSGEWIPYTWSRVPRITCPLYGFDGIPRGIQGRALEPDDVRWCSLKSPPENAWSRFGVLNHDHGENYFQLGEGFGDAGSAYATGTPALLFRGTSMASGVIDTIIAGLRDKVVILAGDNDGAGQHFNQQMGEALTDAGLDVRVLEIPGAVSDVTEWRERDPEAFQREYALALRAAPPFTTTPNTPTPAPTPEPSEYFNTHEGNAQRLIDRMDGTLAFFPEMGRMVYRNGSWGVDKLNVIYHEMTDMIQAMLEEAEELIEFGEAQNNQTLVERGEMLRTFSIRTQNVNNFEAAIKLAEKKTARDFKILDKHKNLLNFKNGTVDLRTGKLKPHDPDDWLTHTLPYNYNPKAECSKFKGFLERIFEDQPEVIPWVNRVCGYAATGETQEQCMIVSVGNGSNGKSVLWNTIGYVLEELTGVVPFSTFEKKGANSSSADLASLQGKRLCLVQEGEANTLLSESVIKRATGGSDRLSARHLYRAQMSFYPEFLIVMSSNSLPRIRGADNGIWRRVRLNHFNQMISDEERNPHLFYELQEEAEGILNWIVKGAISYYEMSGLGDPPVIKEATKQYRHGSDELSGFIGEVIVADPEGKVLGKELMGKYLDWCIEQNVKSWSAQALYNAVSERIVACEKAGSNKGVVLKGIRFATEEDREVMTW